MPVLRGTRGPDSSGDLRGCAGRSRSRHARLAGASRPEPLSGAGAPGGRHPLAAPCSLVRGAGRRGAGRGSAGLERTPGDRARRGLRLRPPRPERGPGRRREPAAQPFAAHLAARAAAGRGRRGAASPEGRLRSLRRPGAAREPGDRRPRRHRAPRGARRPRALRAADPHRDVTRPSRRSRTSCSRPSSYGMRSASCTTWKEPSRSTPGFTRARTGTSSSCRGSRSSRASSSERGSTRTGCRPRKRQRVFASRAPSRPCRSARGSAARPRSPRRGSGPCPSPA